ncbi:1, 4-beta cellobiohydrolase [Daldinia loculata]|nr:1, 4-beta cellobiohydrolase [Daldinia loculata]
MLQGTNLVSRSGAGDDSRYIRPQNEQHFPKRYFWLRSSWDDWCNINGAGFAIRPTSQTNNERLDAFVWVKHPGESDGPSDSAESEYDVFCGKEDAVKLSPGVGLWHQDYFEMLVRNADPSL